MAAFLAAKNKEVTIMCKQETTVNETASETSPDEVVESQPEEVEDCVQNASSAEAEETDKQQLNLFSPTDEVDETKPEMDSSDKNDLQESENLTTSDDASVEASTDNVDETKPEMDSPDANDLPESENLTTSDDASVKSEQNTLEEMNKTLSDVCQLLNQSVAQNSAQTEIFQSTQGLSAKLLAELKKLFEKHISRNVNQNTMFDKMYREMEGYKENFLLEALHKPVIRNLIQFYDDFTGLESQFEDILCKNEITEPEGLPQELQRFQKNMKNVRLELEEALYRMDVTLYEEQQETLNRKLHKTIQVVPTDDPDKDRKVAEVRKKGFSWRDKVFRPEEVTVYRYEPPEVKSEEETDEHTLNEEGVEIDE